MIDNPGRTVQLADGQTYTVRFTTRELIAIERELGGWSKFSTAWDQRHNEIASFLLQQALAKPLEEVYDLMLGVPRDELLEAVNGAIDDAMPMTRKKESGKAKARAKTNSHGTVSSLSQSATA